MSASAGGQELARLRDALKPLCESFVADGYTMILAGLDQGRLKVVIEAGEGACEECLVPKEILSGIVLNSLPPESGVAAIELIYPRD